VLGVAAAAATDALDALKTQDAKPTEQIAQLEKRQDRTGIDVDMRIRQLPV